MTAHICARCGIYSANFFSEEPVCYVCDSLSQIKRGSTVKYAVKLAKNKYRVTKATKNTYTSKAST